jgi:hypothetical protein
MRVMFVIPTTAGPLVITALRPRPGLPVSAAFADGDFRGLAWSGDYARLCTPGGPLSRVIPGLAPHEMRLSGSFDAGRSWEAPVALAHLLLARGHACAAGPAEAEAIVWTTGAIDLDLAPIGGDYALTDKIEKTATLFAGTPDKVPLFAILPPASDAEAAWVRLQAIAGSRRVTRIAAMPMAEAATALLEQMTPTLAGAPAREGSPYAWLKAVAALAVALAVAGSLGTYAFNWATSEPRNQSGPVATPTPVNGVGPKTSTNDLREHDAAQPAPSPRVVISEIRASAGSDCRRVLFAPDLALRHPLTPIDDTTFTASRLDDTLCGIAIKPMIATDRFAIEGDLPAATLPPGAGPDGATIYLLRANRQQNVVYQIHVSSATENGPSHVTVIRHAILR